MDIIEQLKSEVYWEMTWDQKMFPEKPEKEIMFEKNIALAVLLLADQVFINDYWWMEKEGWPEEACRMPSLNLNTNDILMSAAADAYTMQKEDIKDVYDHWVKDPNWGTAVWYCKKMNLMPQTPVAERIRAAGIWDIDNMGLNPNPDTQM